MGKLIQFEAPEEEYWQWKRQKDDQDETWLEFFANHIESIEGGTDD